MLNSIENYKASKIITVLFEIAAPWAIIVTVMYYFIYHTASKATLMDHLNVHPHAVNCKWLYTGAVSIMHDISGQRL